MKRPAMALVALLALALAGGAIAYFTTTGSGSGTAQVTSSASNAGQWAVTVNSDTTDNLLPGSGTASLPYTVTNNSAGHEGLTNVTVTMPTTTVSGNTVIENSSGTGVAGCLASWFTLDGGAAGSLSDTTPTGLSQTLPYDAAHGASVTGTATVTMVDVNANQNACQGILPKVTVTAS